MKNLSDKQQAVLIERHLTLESQLAELLNELNQASAEVLSSAGLQGPSPADLETMEPVTKRVQQSARKVADSRQLLFSRVAITHVDRPASTIKQLIGILPPADRTRLNALRRAVLDKSSEAQSHLVRNQAVLFYTFDFHRKYLAGVLQGDAEPQNYAADGQTQDLQPGNIFGKTC